MMSSPPPDHGAADPFAQLAAESELLLQADALYHAPHDALESPGEADRAYLVTLTAGSISTEHTLRLVFLATPIPIADGGPAANASDTPPTMRDVLWWLAADAWAVEHAKRDPATWAAHHAFDARAPATQRRFDQLLRQATTLSTLLGAQNYARLLDLHVDLSGGRGPEPTSTL